MSNTYTDRSAMPKQFYATERNIAKGYATHPMTAEYIERLERIAKAAHTFWNLTEIKPGHREQSRSEHVLYDAMFAVNFMDDEAAQEGA